MVGIPIPSPTPRAIWSLVARPVEEEMLVERVEAEVVGNEVLVGRVEGRVVGDEVPAGMVERERAVGADEEAALLEAIKGDV